MTAGGTGYTSAPSVAFIAPQQSGGVAPTAIAVLNGTVVSAVYVTSQGSGYVVAPTISFSGGGGSNAAATCQLFADYALTALISRASSVILNAANIQTLFDSGQNITEKRNGNGRDFLRPNVPPIISISSLTIIPQAWSFGASLLPTVIPASDGSTVGYLFDSERVYLIGYLFEKGVQNIALVYRGGITANSQTQLMLEQACLVTCALWWKRRPHIEMASQMSPTIGTTAFTMKDLPAEAWTIINQIKRVAPIV